MCPVNEHKHQQSFVADDEPDFADIIAEVAREIGFHTHCVYEGDKVVDEVTTIDPAAIVLDLRMPGADGVEIIRELGKLRCSAKIVLMSGMDQRTLHSVESLGREKRLDIVGTLTKPMRPQEITAILSPIFDAAPPPLILEESPAEELLPELGFQTLYTLIKPLNNDGDARQPNRVRLSAQWQLDNGEVLTKASLNRWAEKQGIQNGLLRLMLRDALQQCEALGQKDISMELIVSLDAQQLQDLSIVDFIDTTVRQSKVDNSSVLIEIAEDAASQSQGNAIDVLSRLRIKGYKIAVMTESSEESLLAIMDKFPLDEICVDLYSLAQ
ncbi:MAG: response regulator [Gammaproteobacteria bacterium]|nr:response regulator [Gammaproteobacteria bacterium]MDP6732695.1 response regulator [Gammaproteobacteria bacterium]